MQFEILILIYLCDATYDCIGRKILLLDADNNNAVCQHTCD